jgi:hypothetical protein
LFVQANEIFTMSWIIEFYFHAAIYAKVLLLTTSEYYINNL